MAVSWACEPVNVGETPASPSPPTPTLLVTPGIARADVGASQQFRAEFAGSVPGVGVWVWTTSNETTVLVDQNGSARCRKTGAVTVGAHYILPAATISGSASLTCGTPGAPLPRLNLIRVSPESVDAQIKQVIDFLVCTFTVVNISNRAVTVVYSTDHPALRTNVSNARIPAGGSVIVNLLYAGGQQSAFTAILSILASIPAEEEGEGEQDFRGSIRVRF
jgi:hypothetical protein